VWLGDAERVGPSRYLSRYNLTMTSDTSKSAYPSHISLRPVEGPVHASVTIPGSKSITNRALLIAALAEGNSVLGSPLRSDDTEAMSSALIALGSKVSQTPEGYIRVEGCAAKFSAPKETLFIGNSGTTVRFLAAACAYIPAEKSCILDGNARMRERPITDLLDALAPLGVKTESIENTGCPPVRVHGGGIKGGETTVGGAISSQYLSALMMAAPSAASDTTIKIAGELVSKPYVAMTTSVMRAFGAVVPDLTDDSLVVPSRQTYRARHYLIEPDASNASYFLAAAAVTGWEVTIVGLGSNSIQGDVHFAEALQQCGATVDMAPNTITIRGPERLSPVDIDLTLMPDVAQTLAVICLFADGVSTIRGLQTLKVKETDRIEAIAAELRKLGAAVEVGPDYWVITPPNKVTAGVAIATYDDHRMAMSFAVAGLKVPITIDEPGCVAKTFPSFWTQWDRAFYDVTGVKR
jgi:3-phosphoshikimate 1-carboxyvinyltransferase